MTASPSRLRRNRAIAAPSLGGRPEIAPAALCVIGQAVNAACERSNCPVAAEIAPWRFAFAPERK